MIAEECGVGRMILLIMYSLSELLKLFTNFTNSGPKEFG